MRVCYAPPCRGGPTIRTHYLNADFDLGLRARPRRLARPAVRRLVVELSLLGVLGAGRGDAVLARARPCDDWSAALDALGQPAPRLLPHPAVDRSSRLEPFGWSAEAIELNRAHDVLTSHPPFEVVRRVNSRVYAAALERRLFPEDRGGTAVVSALADLPAAAAAAAGGTGVVVKADHGNAGVGNRRLRSGAPTRADRAFVAALLAEDDAVVVEPWRERRRDWSVAFDVPFAPATCRVYETLQTADGAPLGVFHDPAGAGEAPRAALADAARRIAAALAGDGYFGPVCVDAFEWSDGDRTALRRLVDLNARRALSAGAFRLVDRVLADRAVLFRLFNRTRLRLPDRFDEATAALGDAAYDPGAGRGVAIVSPLVCRDGGDAWRTTRVAALIAGRDRDDVRRLERAVRRRLER